MSKFLVATSVAWVACAALTAPAVAQADAVDTLRAFVRDVQSAQGSFTQTVTSPDGKKVRKSTGVIELQRPNRFRFEYRSPMAQVIVGDGQKVWLYDEDLNQVTVRAMTQAVGASPAALLAGASLDKDFVLKALAGPGAGTPAGAGIEWVEATPRQKDGQFRSVKVGFKGETLAALEVLDAFGQTSRMDFAQFNPKALLAASRFVFTPPKGADVLDQP
jgi:outer membrane lipoprotein carrier protein